MADSMTRYLFTTIPSTLMKLPAIRRGYQKATAKSLVISHLRESEPQTSLPQAEESWSAGVFGVKLALFAVLFSFAATAEDFRDPTRPPASLLATPGAVPGQGATESRPAGLQSIIISESRRAAIIDGKTVELWAKHGNAQLIEVNEDNVVLQGAQTRRVLRLFPDVKMKQRAIQTENASPQSEVLPEDISTTPAAQNETLLSGHPKEEK